MHLRAALEGNLTEILKEEEKNLARAVTDAVREIETGLKEELRQQVRGSGLGEKLAKAWQSKTYPRGKDSLNAAAFVYSKAPVIHRAFNESTIIKSKDGWFLAIPTAAAPKTAGGKRITPSLYEKFIGRLRLIYRRGRPSLLVADNQRARTGKRGGFTKASDRAIATGRGVVTVVMFILVPQVSLRRRLNFESASNNWQSRLPAAVLKRL